MSEIIPEMHTQGSISPHTLFVDLNRASRADLEAARVGDGAPQAWELYEHEARHWLDLVGTVWGREYLDLLFRTFDVVLSTPSRRREETFEIVLQLFDRDRSILFPSYYKYVLPTARALPAKDAWGMSFSTGVKVDSDGRLDSNRPFVFVRFDAGTTHFARQPVSDGSLLESRALAAEVAATTAWLKMRAPGEEVVTWKLREREQRAALYDPELTTYSVASHVVAYATGVNDVRQNLALASKLADVVLNLTPAAFSKLKPTNDFGDPGYSRLRGFRGSQNRGYAFCALAFALRGQLRNARVGSTEIEAAAKLIGMPTLATIYANARHAIDKMPGRLAVHPQLAAVRGKLLQAGRRIHQRPDLDAEAVELCPSADLPAPLVCDSEIETFSLGAAPLNLAESEFLDRCHDAYREVLRPALRAARGLEFEFSDFVY